MSESIPDQPDANAHLATAIRRAVAEHAEMYGPSTKMERVEAAIEMIEDALYGFTIDKVGDPMKLLKIQEAAKVQHGLKTSIDALAANKTILQKVYDFARYSVLPTIMEDNDITNIKVAGVGSVSLTADLRASVKPGLKVAAMEYLDDTGHGDIITKTIPAGTLKALAKDCMQKGDDLPEDIFRVDPFTRAQIKKG
ncbi:MAG: hypothetical protein KUG64_11135 [Cycloclasticus sp.]|nr:hypothetical protein [Cycloclasticus sp.]